MFPRAILPNTSGPTPKPPGKMREKFAILRYFDDAFSKTAEWIKNGKPRRGEVQLGLVYNMGYVVKTPTLTFAIDLCHPRAAEIADNLDFLLITHNHQDHLSLPLINTLKKAGKPIVQNYMDTPHYSAGNRRLKFGDATILTKCCDHNRRLERFVLTYEIDCGKSAGNARIFHTATPTIQNRPFRSANRTYSFRTSQWDWTFQSVQHKP